MATGHYARVMPSSDGTLRVSAGARRRQGSVGTFCFGLKRELLGYVLFPVGGYTKSEIRAIAREADLPVHDKPDSQDICFVPDDDHVAFVRDRLPGRDTAGSVVDEDGTVLGSHSGFEAFTIGQRRGLGIALGTPRYVVQIEPATRTVTLGPKASPGKGRAHGSALPTGKARSRTGLSRVLAQIRAQHRARPLPQSSRSPAARAKVVFASPSRPAIAPGQVVTVYQGELVLGGGLGSKARHLTDFLLGTFEAPGAVCGVRCDFQSTPVWKMNRSCDRLHRCVDRARWMSGAIAHLGPQMSPSNSREAQHVAQINMPVVWSSRARLGTGPRQRNTLPVRYPFPRAWPETGGCSGAGGS